LEISLKLYIKGNSRELRCLMHCILIRQSSDTRTVTTRVWWRTGHFRFYLSSWTVDTVVEIEAASSVD